MATLITTQDLTKSVHHRTLFRDLSISFSDSERTGMIGPNGAGKSTLLRILAGLDEPDAGTMNIRRNLRVGYLAQQEQFDAHASAADILAAAADHLHDLHQQQTAAAVLMGRLGFEDPEQPAGQLSGGWRKRLAIACQLIREPDLLLLDEPTNHLDVEGILWLEQLLRDARFAFVVVSHDRYLLDNVAQRIVEINPAYPGGYYSVDNRYSVFLQRRETFLEGQREQQRVLASKVKREIEWMTEGRKAQRKKDQARKDEAGRLIEQLADLSDRNTQRSAGLEFDASGRKTRKLVFAEGISKRMGDRVLFENLDVRLSPGSRVGLLGANGSGKSTLIRVLSGALQPDAGVIQRADDLQLVVFDQQRADLPPDALLPEALAGKLDHVTFRGQRIHVAGWAQRFLFSTEQFRMQVRDMSGGEQARIQIARLMLQPADVLILDEPTNDLDIASLDILEESLSSFPGALLLVSHDRYQLDSVCDEIIALEGDGRYSIYGDTWTWQTQRSRPERDKARSGDSARKPAPGASASSSAPAAPAAKAQPASKLSWKEQRELEGMEGAILAAERARDAARRAADDPATAASHVELQKRYAALATAEQQVERLYARWAELEAKAGG